MDTYHFDFETYSEADVKKVGAWAYSQHPSTEVICMAYAKNDEEPVLWLPGEKRIPSFLHEDSIGDIKAWNSFFEYCICVNTLKIQPPPIKFWHDVAAKAAALALPRSLEKCGEALQLPTNKTKDKRGKNLINKLSKPRKKKVKGVETFYRDRNSDLLREFYEYCLQDVRVERTIDKMLMDLSPTEREVWILDQEVNIRGIQVDTELVNTCIQVYEKQKSVLMNKLKALTGLDNPNSQPQFLKWAQDNGFTGGDLQAETLRDFLKESTNV